MLCVEDSHGCHVVIGVGRVIVQRHHASTTYKILNSHFLYFQSNCALVVRLYVCDRQFFPVAIYCTLLHRENASFEVLFYNIRTFIPGIAGTAKNRMDRNMELTFHVQQARYIRGPTHFFA